MRQGDDAPRRGVDRDPHPTSRVVSEELDPCFWRCGTYGDGDARWTDIRSCQRVFRFHLPVNEMGKKATEQYISLRYKL